jgi:hypothetical protein
MKAWQQGWPIEMIYSHAICCGCRLPLVAAIKNPPAASITRRKTYKFVQEHEIC